MNIKEISDVKFDQTEEFSNPITEQQVQAEPAVVKLKDLPLKTAASEEAKVEPKYVKEQNCGDPRYERIYLPSNCIFYDFDTIQVREFTVEDLALICKSVDTKNFSTMVDAIGNTIYGDVNVRELTTRDFFFLMYHHRLTDYPSSPWIIPWTSRYGNKITTQVEKSVLKILTMKMTKEEYKEKYLDKYGITFPRVKDLEYLQDIDDKDADIGFMSKRAQYLIGDSFEDKMDRIKKAGVSLLEAIRSFNAEAAHGVEESVWLQDTKFEPKSALEYLCKTAEEMEEIIKAADFDTSLLSEKLGEVEEEIGLIEKALADGSVIEPAKEEVGVKIDALKFFPSI